MNFPDKLSPLVILTLLLNLNACSTIKEYFPDKHKEYVNSVEIAPLVIPPDLSMPNFAKDDLAIQALLSTQDKSAVNGTPEAATQVDSTVPEKAKQEQDKEPERIRLVAYAGGATRLQIDEPYVMAWRIVGKSLSRKSLEIIDRNINDGLFLIQYDPVEPDIEDAGIWDELTFIFGDDKSNEQKYQIRLIEDEGTTEVLVLDQQGTPLSTGIGLNLLNLIYDTIKTVFAEQKK